MADNIRTYTSPNAPGGIQTDFSKAASSYKERGDTERMFANQSASDIANGIGALGRGIDSFVASRKAAEAAQSKDEINKLQTTFALNELNNSDAWDATLAGADPNDTSVGNKFLEEQFAKIDETVAAATTPEAKAYAEKEATRQKINLTKTVHADVSTIAGYNAVANVEKAVNAGATFLQSNPEQLDDKLAHVEGTIASAIPDTADPKVRAKALADSTLNAKQAYVKSALGAMAAKTPDDFLKRWEAGEFKKYADAGLLSPNDNYVAVAKDAQAKAASAANAQNVQKNAENRKAIADYSAKLVSSTIQPDGTRRIGPDFFKSLAPDGQLANMPGVTREDITTLDNWGRSIMNGTTAKENDPATVADFNQRMFLPQSDPKHLTEQQIIQAVVDGKLKSGAEGDGIFYKAIATMKPDANGGTTPTLTSAYTDLHTNALHIFDAPTYSKNGRDPSPQEAAEEQKYQQWFAPAYLAQLKTADNPNGKTPQQLLTPGSPDYLPAQYPGLTKEEKSKLSTFYPVSVKPPAGAVAVPGGAVVPPAARPSLDSIFGAPAAVKPQASLDTRTTGSIQLAAERTTIGANNVLFSQAPVQAAVQKVSAVIPNAVTTPTPSGKSVPDLVNEGHKSTVELASSFLGQTEVANRQTLSAFMKSAAGINIDPADTAWCAAWANAVLAASGYAQGRGNGAKGTVGNGMWAWDFENYGTDATGSEQEGDIVTFRWKNGGGHVGFFMGYQEVNGVKYVRVLGGNQGGAKMQGGGVSISLEPASEMSAVRHPVKLASA